MELNFKVNNVLIQTTSSLSPSFLLLLSLFLSNFSLLSLCSPFAILPSPVLLENHPRWLHRKLHERILRVTERRRVKSQQKTTVRIRSVFFGELLTITFETITCASDFHLFFLFLCLRRLLARMRLRAAARAGFGCEYHFKAVISQSPNLITGRK